jgi:Protein of unknown function (DUF3592)
MVFRARPASDQPPGYPPQGWQPEQELQTAPPRTVRLTWKHVMVLILALALLFLVFVGVLLPVAGRAYVFHVSAPAQGTIVKLAEVASQGGHGPARRYVLTVRYRTPEGEMVKSGQVSPETYRAAHIGETIAIHFLRSHPDRFVVDRDQRYQMGPATVIIVVELVLAIILARLVTTELKIVRAGSVLPGVIVSTASGPRRAIVLHFQYRGQPYQLRVVQKRGVSVAKWGPGKAMTLLVEDEGPAPTSRPRVVAYPYSIFKCVEQP